MINIAVCDDNPVFLNEITKLIEEIFIEEHTISKFNNAQSFISRIEDYSEDCIDIVLTDIEMPEVNGITMARELKALHPRLQFIFVTNYTDYIEEAFSVEPVFYILKPVDPQKLSEALIKATRKIESENRSTFNVTTKNKVLRIRFDEMKYVESYRRTVIIHELRQNTELVMKLDDFCKQVPDFFIRTHKSYLVNMNMIRNISNNRIELFTGETVPVAKAKYHEIKTAILRYLGEVL